MPFTLPILIQWVNYIIKLCIFLQGEAKANYFNSFKANSQQDPIITPVVPAEKPVIASYPSELKALEKGSIITPSTKDGLS